MPAEASSGRYIIGIDTGGTFNDFVLLDLVSKKLSTAKVPSNAKEPSRPITAGLNELATGYRGTSDWSVDPGMLRIVVGTTVATNAILERNGPTVVFITNEGFTDVPFIGRLDKERLYDLHWTKPAPLVLRRNCIGVRGRIGHDGRVVEPLDIENLADVVRLVTEQNGKDGESPVQLAVAICTLFSYLNPSHEVALADQIAELLPGVPVSVSHQVSPIWREYERASTTVADVFIKPTVDEYISGVGATISAKSGGAPWHLLASNGGQLTPNAAVSRPSQVVLSGLAGGVVGAQFFAEVVQCRNFFSLDMGGTSCDIGLVVDGTIDHATEFELAWGLPLTVPCVAVETIGAGGGSIAWIDKGGLLHVGPQSAGAEPGPAAYGLGGDRPTVTDANIVLGRLTLSYLLGGKMPLDPEAASKALARIGGPLGLDEVQAAVAVVRTADENMANAIRLIAVERGIDPRDFSLVAFGGAGPLHGREVAARLGIRRILVPPHPGLCGAVGALIATPRVDRVRTYYVRSANVDIDGLAEVERELRGQAESELARSRAGCVADGEIRVHAVRGAELRTGGRVAGRRNPARELA